MILCFDIFFLLYIFISKRINSVQCSTWLTNKLLSTVSVFCLLQTQTKSFVEHIKSHRCKTKVHNKLNELRPVCSLYSHTHSLSLFFLLSLSIFLGGENSTTTKIEFIEIMRFFGECKDAKRNSRISNTLVFSLYLFLAIVCSIKAYSLFTW